MCDTNIFIFRVFFWRNSIQLSLQHMRFFGENIVFAFLPKGIINILLIFLRKCCIIIIK